MPYSSFDAPFTASDAIDAKQREGNRDPVSFTVDSPSDQAAVKRSYEDAAGMDADDYIKALRAASGASVSIDGKEVDDYPIVPRYGHQGQTGLGGSFVGEMSPEQLMARSDNEMNALAKAQDGSSAVDSSLIKTGYVDKEPPEFLKAYIESQPFTDPYHQTPMSGVDMVLKNKYLSDQQKRKYIELLRDHGRAEGTR